MMSLTAAADATPPELTLGRPDNHRQNMENNENPEQNVEQSRSYESDDKEDPATQAASENLKHTTISDKEPVEGIDVAIMSDAAPSAEDETDETAKPMTPEPAGPSDAQDEEMKERISSPKKKRGREQDDEARPEAADEVEEIGGSPNGTAINGGRTTRSAPVKKRHRDTSADAILAADSISEPKELPTTTIESTISEPDIPSPSSITSPKPTFGSSLDPPQTSSSAFASSGFGSLASSTTSGFAALAASKPPVFGAGAKSPVSGFGALAAAQPIIPETSTKSGFGNSAPATSPPLTLGSGFATTSSSGFGSLGSGFGSGFGGFSGGSGPKLSSFAASSSGLGGEKSSKAPKAFGAPDSGEDENSTDDDDESKGGAASDEDESVSLDEKKRTRLSRVPVNDGEEGEATLLQFRAKLYALAGAWKERGVGTLKLNVPSSFVEYDENDAPISGTYDPSGRDESDDTHETSQPAARLIMRQENTHRVILNTVIIKALKFEEKPGSPAYQILFTAFEDGKPVNMLLKVNEMNAKRFMSEVATVQREL